MHTCIHTHIHMYTCTCSHTPHAHTHTHTHAYTHTHVHTHTHAYTHTHTHTRTHTHMYTHTHTHTHNTHTYTHNTHTRGHTHTHTHTYTTHMHTHTPGSQYSQWSYDLKMEQSSVNWMQMNYWTMVLMQESSSHSCKCSPTIDHLCQCWSVYTTHTSTTAGIYNILQKPATWNVLSFNLMVQYCILTCRCKICNIYHKNFNI